MASAASTPTLSASFERLISELREVVDDVPESLKACVAAIKDRVASTSIAESEVDEGLRVFWKFMRYLDPPYPASVEPSEETDELTAEGYGHSEETQSHDEETPVILSGQQPAMRPQLSTPEFHAELMRQLERTRNLVERHLPCFEDFRDEYPLHSFSFWSGEWDFAGDVVFGTDVHLLLQDLTRVIRQTTRDSQLFWAVLGPLVPRHESDPRDRHERTLRERQAFLEHRFRSDQADLWELWQLFNLARGLADEDDIFEAILDHVRSAPLSELEDFFRGLGTYDQFDGKWLLVEKLLPDAGRLWDAVIQRDGKSRWLLARAGLYFWDVGSGGLGRSLPLAAFGRACEYDLTLQEEKPFLPFWAAARAAFAEHEIDPARLELARDCLNRAFLDVALWSPFVAREPNDRSYQRFDFSCDFLDLIDRRFPNDPPDWPSPKLYLYEALERLAQQGADRASPLVRNLEALADRTGAWDHAHARELKERLGASLWGAMTRRSKDRLLDAELLWKKLRELRRSEFGPIGVLYRQVIEEEWETHLFRLLFPESHRSPKLSEYLKTMRRDPGRCRVMVRFGPGLKLLDPYIQGRADLLLPKLNGAAHEGLSEFECPRLRMDLFQEGLLRDLVDLKPDEGLA